MGLFKRLIVWALIVGISFPVAAQTSNIETDRFQIPWLQPGSIPDWLAGVLGTGEAPQFSGQNGLIAPPAPPAPAPLFPVQIEIPGEILNFSPNISEVNINIARYWNYRNRLRNNFVVRDTTFGGCLPAEFILTQFDSQSGSEKKLHARWGDGTIQLGWYIGVLATEIGMLLNIKDYGGFGSAADLVNAKNELYCALMALERLDLFGEQALWVDHNIYLLETFGAVGFFWPSTPGFFIRDDVTKRLMERLGAQSGASDSTIYIGKDENGNEVEIYPPELKPLVNKAIPLRTDKQMSQDQVAHLLIGLALVKKFVPDLIWHNGEQLNRLAKIKTRDIINYISKSHVMVKGLYPELDISMRWWIEDPVSPQMRYWGECPTWSDPWHFCVPWFDPFHAFDERDMNLVDRGPAAWALSYGFNQAGRWITGDSHPVLEAMALNWLTLYPGLATSGQLLSEVINSINRSAYFNAKNMRTSDNIHMLMSLGAVSNGWGDPATLPLLEVLALHENFWIYPLLNSVLHKDGWFPPLAQTPQKVRDLLKVAPFGGPATPPEMYNGWGSPHRFIKDSDLHNDYGMKTGNIDLLQYYNAKLAFNGLDYMLLNNLYYLAFPRLFRNVVVPADRPQLPELPPPSDWPAPPRHRLSPIGYGMVTDLPKVHNRCEANAYVELPIVVEYDDPYGNRDTVQIQPLPPQVGGLFLSEDNQKNHFRYIGPFWDNWTWHDRAGFILWDEDGNSFRVKDIPISYPGAIKQPPNLGSLYLGHRIDVYGWYEKTIPLYGVIEWDFNIYAIDTNCVPWRKTNFWWVAKMENGVAWRVYNPGLDPHRLKVATGWTLFDLHGTAYITIGAISNVGGPIRYYRFPISW